MLAAGSVLAGEPQAWSSGGEASAEAGVAVEWSIGYDTHYVFRGEPLQENTGWTQLSVDVPLGPGVTWNLSPWFLQDLDTDYNEFDAITSLNLEAGEWQLSLGYAGYFYPRGGLGGGEGIGDEHEAFFSAGREWEGLSATATVAWNFDRRGAYYELALDYPLEVTSWLQVTPGVAAGADSDYYGEGTEFNHVRAQLAAEVRLSENVTLSPYVAAVFPTGSLRGADDEVYGGVALAVSF